jgi:glycosyltransferase involved in cell wall biosynthesis
MRIALISPYIRDTTPPSGWGPHMEMVHALAEGMLRRGHEVILYATGDSSFSGDLRWKFRCATGNPVYLTSEDRDYLEHNLWSFKDALAANVDVIHSHAPHSPMFMFQVGVGVPQVQTHHSVRDSLHVLTWGRLRGHLDPQKTIADVCLSRAHARVCAKDIRYRVIYHGLDPTSFVPRGAGRGEYVATFSRIHPQKGIHHAIRAAKLADVPLKIAGPLVDVGAQHYFDSAIRPHLSSQIQYVGVIRGHDEKLAFLSGATALLNPICWEEPFGLSVLESIFCGTPVISFARGAAPEVIDNGVTGFFATDAESMALAIPRVHALDRDLIRVQGVRRFSTDRMLDAYERLYIDMAKKRRSAPPSALRVVNSLERLDVMSWTQFVLRLVELGAISRLFGVRVRTVLLISKLLRAGSWHLHASWWRLAHLLGR